MWEWEDKRALTSTAITPSRLMEGEGVKANWKVCRLWHGLQLGFCWTWIIFAGIKLQRVLLPEISCCFLSLCLFFFFFGVCVCVCVCLFCVAKWTSTKRLTVHCFSLLEIFCTVKYHECICFSSIYWFAFEASFVFSNELLTKYDSQRTQLPINLSQGE